VLGCDWQSCEKVYTMPRGTGTTRNLEDGAEVVCFMAVAAPPVGHRLPLPTAGGEMEPADAWEEGDFDDASMTVCEVCLGLARSC